MTERLQLTLLLASFLSYAILASWCLYATPTASPFRPLQTLHRLKPWRLGEEEWSPLILAAYDNHLELVELFARSGHDKELGDRTGASPLFVAAQEGQVAVVQYLAEQGVDIDMRTPSFRQQIADRRRQ